MNKFLSIFVRFLPAYFFLPNQRNLSPNFRITIPLPPPETYNFKGKSPISSKILPWINIFRNMYLHKLKKVLKKVALPRSKTKKNNSNSRFFHSRYIIFIWIHLSSQDFTYKFNPMPHYFLKEGSEIQHFCIVILSESWREKPVSPF